MLFCLIFHILELEQLKDHFQLLSALPASTRSSLLQQTYEHMQDPAAISALQIVVSGTLRFWSCRSIMKLNVHVSLCQLDQMFLGDVGLTESQQQKIQEILNLLEHSGQAESIQTKPFLTALHLIISALDGKKEFSAQLWQF